LRTFEKPIVAALVVGTVALIALPLAITLHKAGAATAPATAERAGRVLPIVVDGAVVKGKPDAPVQDVLVGSFTDKTANDRISYQATIQWGDGSLVAGATAPQSVQAGNNQNTVDGERPPGAITQVYLVTGSHTYRTTGIFPINVTIASSDGRSAYISSIARISNPPVAATATETETATANATGTATSVSTGTAIAVETDVAATVTAVANATGTAIAANTGTAIAAETGTAIAANTGTAIAAETGTAIAANTGTAIAAETGTALANLSRAPIPTDTPTTMPVP